MAAHQSTNVPTAHGMKAQAGASVTTVVGDKPKGQNLPVHPAMAEQVNAAGQALLGHATGSFKDAPDASSGNPLDPSPGKKFITDLQIKPGMKSQQSGADCFDNATHNDWGVKVIDEGVAVAGPDHPANVAKRR